MTGPSRRDAILYAAASDEAYREPALGDPLRIDGAPTGYVLVANRYDPEFSIFGIEQGFAGQAYYSQSENRLLIVFEGTSSVADWVNTNILMTLGHVTEQARSAISFTEDALRHAGEGTEVVFTGHSLGGYLAQYALVNTLYRPVGNSYVPRENSPAATAVAFNSPGLGGWPGDVWGAGVTAPVTYIFSADWDASAAAVHALGDRLSDDVFYVAGTSGHPLSPMLGALNEGAALIATDGEGPRLRPLTAQSSVENYWSVLEDALDRREMVTFEWSFDDGSGLRYTLEQRLHPGGDVRNGGETGVAFVIRTSVRTEEGRLMTRAEMRELGLEPLVVGTRLDSGNWTWEERCFVAGTPITLADGTMRAIEAIRPGDRVLSYAADGTLTPARVTRTFVNEATCVLDFHGTGVTPGHVFLCGEGRFAGPHVPLIDILRDDGAVGRQDGGLMRAASGEPVGSDDDAERVNQSPRAETARDSRIEGPFPNVRRWAA